MRRYSMHYALWERIITKARERLSIAEANSGTQSIRREPPGQHYGRQWVCGTMRCTITFPEFPIIIWARHIGG